MIPVSAMSQLLRVPCESLGRRVSTMDKALYVAGDHAYRSVILVLFPVAAAGQDENLVRRRNAAYHGLDCR